MQKDQRIIAIPGFIFYQEKAFLNIKQNKMNTVVKRMKRRTPKFFKKVRNTTGLTTFTGNNAETKGHGIKVLRMRLTSLIVFSLMAITKTIVSFSRITFGCIER